MYAHGCIRFGSNIEGEIGTEANDLVNCIPERGHMLILKNSNYILFCSIPFFIRCTTTMSTVLVVTSASTGLVIQCNYCI